MEPKLNIILNGKATTGTKGESILSVAQRHGINIPTLCHDPRLEPYSSCYVCVVEIEGMRGLQPSCSTRITEGMKVNTDNERIFAARKTALDLMLSNHHADCVAPCKLRCPAGVDVQGYISLIEKGLYSEAVELIKEVNPLPAICGRVCVRPCELDCRRNLLDEGAAVGIDYLKRYTSDKDLDSPAHYKPTLAESTGKKIAIIGAGPGGLSAAWFLQRKGHQCDIFEAAPQAGGWLRYGIPEYRLPNDLLQREVDAITELGVNIHYGQNFGGNLSYADLKKQYDAVVLTIGSQKGTLLGCEGEEAIGVYAGIDFLKNMEVTGKRPEFQGKTVAVVGGGNTAMDCCRTSIRCGAEKVYVIYRRTEKEMPANPIEIHESKVEGVEYMFLYNPVMVNKNEDGTLKSVTCIRMELGEPDASGRRRPVPVEGSETEIRVDYILAAIGQKTDVNFIDDINRFSDGGELKINRWGDIDADKDTLQTGIPSVFAAGDGVTGPATIIEAIAQAKLASHSCDMFLKGQKPTPPPKEFYVSRDVFGKQKTEDYKGHYNPRVRQEMPVLEEDDRINFHEVELGYTDEQAHEEVKRCLECGCVEYYDCDLKKHSETYHADVKRFAGDYKKYEPDFSHPFVEIDNNKCILCARCVRICSDVVGANALGLVNRGFETFVAPSMGKSLNDTYCESCGMCISACPTGALTENVIFKPGPVKTDSFKSICSFCSVGCEVEYHHKSGFIMKAGGGHGPVNPDGNLCRFGKFGYRLFNSKERITKPLLKTADGFVEISFEEAFETIRRNIMHVKPDENYLYAGARLSNEEMYLIQKFTRTVVKTNNIRSFHYLERGKGYHAPEVQNMHLDAVCDASAIFIIGAEVNMDNGVAGFVINNTRAKKGVKVELVTTSANTSMRHKVDNIVGIGSYYHFVKAVNHYLLSKGKENGVFIADRTDGFAAYKEALLKEDYNALLNAAGANHEDVERFATIYNKEMNAVLVTAEKEVSANTVFELYNLTLITGKHGKTATGMLVLKEKNNSHGLHDMGVCPKLGVGYQSVEDPAYLAKIKDVWGVDSLPAVRDVSNLDELDKGLVKNMFIFGEDPVGCAIDATRVKAWFEKPTFIMVQDAFMTETAQMAHLVMPAGFAFETGGSFTNTSKQIQSFARERKGPLEFNSFEQINQLLKLAGSKSFEDPSDALLEMINLLPEKGEEKMYPFRLTEYCNARRMFNHGCDALVQKFDSEYPVVF
jgi:formate dehydrogenase major subunit